MVYILCIHVIYNDLVIMSIMTFFDPLWTSTRNKDRYVANGFLKDALTHHLLIYGKPERIAALLYKCIWC